MTLVRLARAACRSAVSPLSFTARTFALQSTKNRTATSFSSSANANSTVCERLSKLLHESQTSSRDGPLVRIHRVIAHRLAAIVCFTCATVIHQSHLNTKTIL